jgi:hypothetical protein
MSSMVLGNSSVPLPEAPARTPLRKDEYRATDQLEAEIMEKLSRKEKSLTMPATRITPQVCKKCTGTGTHFLTCPILTLKPGWAFTEEDDDKWPSQLLEID